MTDSERDRDTTVAAIADHLIAGRRDDALQLCIVAEAAYGTEIAEDCLRRAIRLSMPRTGRGAA